MVDIKFNRNVNGSELREVMVLVENQETNDKYIDTTLKIDGEYATIEVEIDEFGDITVL